MYHTYRVRILHILCVLHSMEAHGLNSFFVSNHVTPTGAVESL